MKPASQPVIVLGTPVGVDRRGQFLINYPSRWSATVQRNPFYFYPFSLGYASALLKRETDFSVRLVDAGPARWNVESYAAKVIELKPDIFVVESATRTFQDDLAVAQKVKHETGARIIFVGQHASAFPATTASEVDAVIVGEFEGPLLGLCKHLGKRSSSKNPASIPGVFPIPPGSSLIDIASLPWPEDSDISRLDYAGPLPGHKYRQIQFYASRGCPVMCNFCVVANVYYRKPNWRPRKIDDILAEIHYLVRKYGSAMDGLFFDEEMHVVRKEFSMELCKRLIGEGLDGLRHTAMGAYYTLDAELLQLMAKAGYRQLKIGIETADEHTAHNQHLGAKFNLGKLREVLTIARDVGIEMYGTFQVGGQDATERSDLATAELAYELLSADLLTEMQVSICTPQPGTPFYIQCEKEGWLATHDFDLYDGSQGSVVSYPGYTKHQIDQVYGRFVDIGHHVRGFKEMRRDGLFPTAKRAIQRLGLAGTVRHFVRWYSRHWTRH